MTSDEIKTARKNLGLSATGLAEALRLGKDGGRTVRRWEAGAAPISGPASVAIELMLSQSGALAALNNALAMIGAPADGAEALDDGDIINVAFGVCGADLKEMHRALTPDRSAQRCDTEE